MGGPFQGWRDVLRSISALWFGDEPMGGVLGEWRGPGSCFLVCTVGMVAWLAGNLGFD